MTESVSLAIYEAARTALSECVRVDEVQQVRSDALKMRAYAKIAKDRGLQADAATLVMRAERKLGTLIQSAKEIGQLGFGRKSNLSPLHELREQHVPRETANNGTSGEPLSGDQPAATLERVTLSEVGVDKKLSAKAQKWAKLGDAEFEAKLQAERDRIESIGAAPINGARTVMAGRKEPGASLDYFPTPPWATRALIEDVLDGEVEGVVWEPACGEGHISGVLEGYFETVMATDIHDYSVDGRSPAGWQGVCDFLADDRVPDIIAQHSVDWIITNSPFSGESDRALAFALKALSIAKVGVALFVRTQWLEGVDRYEQLFGVNPPTVIAQFAERVPLVRGRWDPKASTASQYCWVVWIKDEFGTPCAFQWIPPGRRTERTRSTDVERFTAHPVVSIRQDEPAEPAVEGPTTLDGRPEIPAGSPAGADLAGAGPEEAGAQAASNAGAVASAPVPSSLAATPEEGADQSSAPGVGEGAVALPHAGVKPGKLSSAQKDEIIAAGYARKPIVPLATLMAATGLGKSAIKMRAARASLSDPANQKAAVRAANARRAG